MNQVPVTTAKAPEPAPVRAEAVRLPELLAPAGDWECARAAVENGADAIYFGLDRFNARMRARNFTEADLPALMEFLHRRGVKGYVTFNTLVFQNELADAESHLRTLIAAGVDAAIVQDAGICRLIRQLSADFPIHASTQMTVTSAAGVRFARDLGCHLVVLARENSLKEIEAIQSAPRDGSAAMPLEVFVHGALCVAYSGQCLTSEALGGRSANRGECAQACRMPYELIVDGKPLPLGDRRYLLSPQDLAGIEVLPELVRLSVASLKIEGRLKSPEYVANITKVYRQALDGMARRSSENRQITITGADQSRYDLEMAFSRGLHTGWFGGVNNQALVHARFGKKRGVYLGTVSRVRGDRVWVRLAGPLKPGDGVVFDAGQPEAPEEGGRVYAVSPPARGRADDETEIAFGRGDIDSSRIQAGDRLWKTSDPELERRLRRSFEGDTPRFQRPISMETHGGIGQPLVLIARDDSGHVAQVESALPLARAAKQPLGAERLREQLGRLGGTPFRLGTLTNHIEGEVILPVSELNRLRREAVSRLCALRAAPKRWTLETGAPQLRASSREAPPRPAATSAEHPQLIVMVRNLPQLEVALGCGIEVIYCDFEDPKKYREAVGLARTAFVGADTEKTIWVAPPRIFKPGEDWILKQVRSCEADGYLVRNYDHLEFFAGCRRVGDFSLNVANALAADHFKNRYGLERVTASCDLNAAQLEALLQAAPPAWFEVIIHQHMPMFHMEHCVFCAFLSQGTDFTNCGRPCDRHDVKLRDRVGAGHVVKADLGCRNTVFNARAQTGAEHVARMLTLGLQHFRLEFLSETPAEVGATIARYGLLLRGELSGSQLWRELRLHSQLGVTRGTLEKA